MLLNDPDELTARLLQGDRTALARSISWAENGDPRFARVLDAVYGRVGRASRLGITGPPGAGKSTLTNELARLYREAGETVAVLAVDPSSPFTGGALLGDRIRMEERTLDPGVYIRSMASRDGHGGLARATIDACDAMDAFGFDRILLETVGVGQAEFDVVGAADTVLVVVHPGAGDGIQAMKAGLLEVADVLVVNKADQPGAEQLALDLDEAVQVRLRPSLRPDANTAEAAARWKPPVVSVSAKARTGLADLLRAVEDHARYLAADGRLERRRRERRVEQVRHVVAERLLETLWGSRDLGRSLADRLDAHTTPYAAAAAILEPILAAIPYPETEAPTGAQPGGASGA